VGIGTNSPNKLLEISGASGLDNSSPVHFRITNTQSATNGNPFTDITKPAALISYYTSDTSTAGPGDVAGIGFRPESLLGGDTALCFYTDSDSTDDPVAPLQERMCITHDGNVGIGVTNPGVKLHLLGVGTDSGPRLRFETLNNGNSQYTVSGKEIGGIQFGADDYVWNTQHMSSEIVGIHDTPNYSGARGILAFKTTSTQGSNPTEKMRIRYDGNVGIGTTNPSTYLHLSAKNSNPGATEGDFIGTHNLTEYMRFTSQGDSGDVNAVSVGFKLGADDNHASGPDGRLDICANDGGIAGNDYGTTPDRTIATFLGSGNVSIPDGILNITDNATRNRVMRLGVTSGGTGMGFYMGTGGGNVWATTGIPMTVNNTGGGTVLFVFNINRSGGDATSSHFYMIRKRHDGGSNWTSTSTTVQQLAYLTGTSGNGTVYFRQNNNYLEYKFNAGGNGHFYAIECD
jgi:hypothetical protein